MGAGSNEANRRLREMQHAKQFGGASASMTSRVVPRVEGVVRGAAPAPNAHKPAPVNMAIDRPRASVNGGVDKPTPAVSPDVDGDFVSVMDALCSGVSHDDVAARLGVSVAAIRQARLKPDAASRRSPPKGWRAVAMAMAEERADHYRQMADRLAREG